MTFSILIVDDHAVVRDGLKMIIEAQDDLRVVGTSANGLDAVARAQTLRPDVIIMDIAMPEMNGIEACRLICQNQPAIKVIILSMYHNSEHIFRALQAGAQGYLLKDSAGSEVVTALRAVMKGQRFFGRGVELPPDMRTCQIAETTKSPIDSLSRREREVLQHVVEGRTSAEIAELLSLSPKSVETYRSRLMLKLGIGNIPTLVKFALQHGITPAE